MATEWLSRLGNSKLIVKPKRNSIHKGTRQSRTLGTSFDFSDYRQYQPGDDIRQIDWNVYGRTEKVYIKRFLDEREIFVSIYLDCTKSMTVIQNKWTLAKNIAASLSYITLINDDRLTVVTAGLDGRPPIKRKGSLNSKQIYHQIVELPNDGGNGSFTASVEQFLFKHNQLVFIITDGMEDLSRFEVLFKRMAPHTKQIRVLQVLAKEEIRPDYESDLKLIDSEDETIVNVSMGERVYRMYQNRLKTHNETLAKLCKRYGISYLQVSDEDPLQLILFSQFVKNGWLQGR